MFRNILSLGSSFRTAPYVWNDSKRMIEALKLNSPQYIEHLLKKKAHTYGRWKYPKSLAVKKA